MRPNIDALGRTCVVGTWAVRAAFGFDEEVEVWKEGMRHVVIVELCKLTRCACSQSAAKLLIHIAKECHVLASHVNREITAKPLIYKEKPTL